MDRTLSVLGGLETSLCVAVQDKVTVQSARRGNEPWCCHQSANNTRSVPQADRQTRGRR